MNQQLIRWMHICTVKKCQVAEWQTRCLIYLEWSFSADLGDNRELCIFYTMILPRRAHSSLGNASNTWFAVWPRANPTFWAVPGRLSCCMVLSCSVVDDCTFYSPPCKPSLTFGNSDIYFVQLVSNERALHVNPYLGHQQRLAIPDIDLSPRPVCTAVFSLPNRLTAFLVAPASR